MTEERLGLRELWQTCSACPSQWEGITEDGRSIYVRYRWGTLTWGFGDTLDAAVDESIRSQGKQLGEEFDGELDTYTMLDELNLAAPNRGEPDASIGGEASA